MSTEDASTVDPDGAAESVARPVAGGQELVRTRTGLLVPKASLESGFEVKAKVKKKQDEARRKRLNYALGALALALLGAFAVFLTRSGGERAAIESILRDFGYVVAERKGVGIDR